MSTSLPLSIEPSRSARAPEKIHGCPSRTRYSLPCLSRIGMPICFSLRAVARAFPDLPPVDSAAAAALLDQLHIGDRHAAIDGLAHVVDGQRRRAHCSEGFHLDTGAPRNAHLGFDLDAVTA